MKKERRYKVVLDYSGDELKVEVSPPNQTLLEQLAGSLKITKAEHLIENIEPATPRVGVFRGVFRGDSPLDD